MRIERLGETLDYIDFHLGIYPLWNCAYRVSESTGAPFSTDLFVDVGIYGEPTVPNFRPGIAMRALQRFVDQPSYRACRT